MNRCVGGGCEGKSGSLGGCSRRVAGTQRMGGGGRAGWGLSTVRAPRSAGLRVGGLEAG